MHEQMIHRADILSIIKKIIAQKSLTAKPVQLLAEDESLELDSVARLTLMVELENEFQVELMDDEFNPVIFESIAALSDFVERKIKSQKEEEK